LGGNYSNLYYQAVGARSKNERQNGDVGSNCHLTQRFARVYWIAGT
jgi:hypothetical protein